MRIYIYERVSKREFVLRRTQISSMGWRERKKKKKRERDKETKRQREDTAEAKTYQRLHGHVALELGLKLPRKGRLLHIHRAKPSVVRIDADPHHRHVRSERARVGA